jgi:adenosine deaminase CECR1
MNYGFAIKSGDGNNENDHAGTVQLLADVLGDGLPKIQASGLTFYGVKLIYACLRSITKKHMKWCMHTCIELKQKFPDLICGMSQIPISLTQV